MVMQLASVDSAAAFLKPCESHGTAQNDASVSKLE